MAMARPSAASSGCGISRRFRSVLTISCYCHYYSLSLEVYDFFTISGVYSDSSIPARYAARSATPRACPTVIAVVTLVLKKSYSTAIASGW